MSNRFYLMLAILAATLLLVGCSSGSAEDSAVKQPIMVWTNVPSQFQDEEEAIEKIFEEAVDDFLVIHPDVTIIFSPVPYDELLDKFKAEAQLGLGPDLLIGPSFWVPELADLDLIQNLSERQDIDTSIYLSTAVRTLYYQPAQSHQEGLYGLPLTLGSTVLYYNKDLVDNLSPPTTLQALVEQADEDRKVALDTSFVGAFWGIQAFGGQLFDQEGRVVLDQGGFANWLGWLKAAQHNPNIILNNNLDTLLNLFLSGKVAYWVGDSAWLVLLEQTLGNDVVGVAPLPAGPNNEPAGPFLYSAALMVNAASSPAQTERALRLAEFLTNVEQQTSMSLQGKMVPANQQVTIDPRVSPEVAAAAAQTKTAVPMLNLAQMFDVLAYGDDIYVRALAGELGLNEAAAELTERINARYGFEAAKVATGAACDVEGKIEFWYSWTETEAAALAQIAENFSRQCPGAAIMLTPISNQEELYTRYRSAVAAGQGPDLLSLDNRWVVLLAADGLLQDLTDSLGPEFLQRYVPAAPKTTRYKGRLYGLPISMETMALYYNTDLVTDPARDLTDLLSQAAPDRQVVLPRDFFSAFWGMATFGGRVFDTNYRVILDEGGFAEWLSWLQVAQDQPGIILTADLQEALGLFVQGDAAYLAGEKWLLNLLQAELGAEKVGVVPLPAGPRGDAGPFLGVESLLLNPASDANEQALALGFAKYVTAQESQTLLMEKANRVPANVNVDTTGYPAIGGFLRQARTAFVPANEMVHNMFTVFEWGDDLYSEVLVDGRDPVRAVKDFTHFVNTANGFIVPEKPAAEAEQACAAIRDGRLLLWHSWSGEKAAALEQVIANFMEACPGVTLEAELVAASDLVDKVASAAAGPPGSAPDFFLAPHNLIGALHEAALLKEITLLIDPAALAGYLPSAVEALRVDGALYGLPQALDVNALYYNTALVDGPARSQWRFPSRSYVFYNIDRVNSPAGTLDELLGAANPATPVALETSFYGASWGIPAFGGRLLDAEGLLAVDPAGLKAWLAWLQTAQDRPGVIISDDPDELQALFAAGDVAYLVAGPGALKSLRATLGTENVGVTLLPAGPAGEGSPFLRIDAFLFSAKSSDRQTELAQVFAKFATSAASQTLLSQEANLLPTNKLAIEETNDPAMVGFLKQALRTGVVLPHTVTEDTVATGDRVYRQVLAGKLAPEEAANELNNR